MDALRGYSMCLLPVPETSEGALAWEAGALCVLPSCPSRWTSGTILATVCFIYISELDQVNTDLAAVERVWRNHVINYVLNFQLLFGTWSPWELTDSLKATEHLWIHLAMQNAQEHTQHHASISSLSFLPRSCWADSVKLRNLYKSQMKANTSPTPLSCWDSFKYCAFGFKCFH